MISGRTRDRIEHLMRPLLRSRIVQKLVRETIIHIPDVYSPYLPQAQSYAIMKQDPAFQERCPQGLAIPPDSLRMGYGKNYLNSGQENVAKMRAALKSAGHPLVRGQRILEFGCACGRMLRWLCDVSDRSEVWGVDIDATCIAWSSQNLSPPFHFVTISTSAHLPFEDRYFDLIFAGSVFTHIDDMTQAWFLELRRVLKPGGVLYVTIHDKHTIELLRSSDLSDRLTRFLREDQKASEWARSDFAKFTIGRATDSQVFYDVDYLKKSLEPFFKLLSVEEEAYGYQTGILLERQ